MSNARYWFVLVSITDNPLNLVGISGASRKKGCLVFAVAGVLSLPIHTALSNRSFPSLNLIGVTCFKKTLTNTMIIYQKVV